MYYLTVLDYNSGKVCQSCLDPSVENWQTEDYEEYLKYLGYNLDEIEWMSHSDNEIYEL